jgi:UDP-glucose 4-epimerase
LAGDPVFVTGGAGFVGSALSRALLEQGHEVTVFDDLSAGHRDLLTKAPGLRFVQGDVRDSRGLERALREARPRRVFHLAALHYIPQCNAEPVEAVKINVAGTRHLLAACRRTPPEAVFVASTAAVYPAEGSPFSEDAPVEPIDIYGHTKAMAEELTRLFHLETGITSVMGRLFNVFGPNDSNPHLIPDVIAQARAGASTLELGNLTPVRDYIYVDDVVSGILAASHAAVGRQVFNVGTGKGQSVKDVVDAVAEAVGRPLRIVQAEGRMRKVERQELVADARRLTALTGWSARVDFRTGIAALVTARTGDP